MKISEMGEFGLIERIKEVLGQDLPQNSLGIGDDCAVLPEARNRTLVTTDLLVEGVHFLKSAISPKDLGHKSLAVNLSDIAGMGGTPTYAFVSIALPEDTEVEWVSSFYEGLRNLARKYKVSVLGGDTTRSLNGITINITLLGETDGRVKLRSSAKKGDLICVTNTLGDSAGGLQIILNQIAQDSPARQYLVKCHHHPKPQVEEGQWLAQQENVHAMMDVSDGIGSDLKRIIEQSGCGARVDLEKIPLSDQLRLSAKELGWDPLELAISGGEDYCLLLTVDRTSYPGIAAEFKKQFNLPLYAIGEITSDRGKPEYLVNGMPHPLSSSGFDHFRKKK